MDMDMAMGTKLKERLVLSKGLIAIVIIVNVKKDMFIVVDMAKEDTAKNIATEVLKVNIAIAIIANVNTAMDPLDMDTVTDNLNLDKRRGHLAGLDLRKN